ncbi:ferrochelatase-2, chloroplastic-like [Senna tora]|uniref:Ferrochelatase-2, chloroplastic-like n=1 Tax=Senna tora TaxID=362788 RepID=A0A834SRU6_9FABA|nr:ferrochelatase-2, chloroplastic-like [Senna tora]
MAIGFGGPSNGKEGATTPTEQPPQLVCPQHGFPKWLQVQTFYNGLYSTFQTTIDASAGGSLMAKPVEVAYNLLETIALNNYHWQSERHMPRSATEINKVEVINALCAQIATLTKQVHSLRVQASVDAISSFISCELCGPKHLYDQCPENSMFEHYSTNPSWFNALSSSQESKPHPPSVESKPSMEDMPLTYLAKIEGSEKVMEGNPRTEEVDKEPVEEATITKGCFEVCLVNDVVDNLANDDELKYHPIEPSKSSLSFNAKWDADDFVMNSPSLGETTRIQGNTMDHKKEN